LFNRFAERSAQGIAAKVNQRSLRLQKIQFWICFAKRLFMRDYLAFFDPVLCGVVSVVVADLVVFGSPYTDRGSESLIFVAGD